MRVRFAAEPPPPPFSHHVHPSLRCLLELIFRWTSRKCIGNNQTVTDRQTDSWSRQYRRIPSPGPLADGARGGFHNLSDAKGHVRYTPISILHTTNINFTEMKSFRIPLRVLFPFRCLFCASTIRKMCSFRGSWIHKLLTWSCSSILVYVT